MISTIDLTCPVCGNIFTKLLAKYKISSKASRGNYIPKCSPECFQKSRKKKRLINCSQCNKKFEKSSRLLDKSKNHFCSQSCSATYNNTHKTTGTRRSKLEQYLEEMIRKEYPDLFLLCNDKTAINSELDFYFPDLKLAVELNGIFHYEPIYGPDKLTRIQDNDKQKFIRCYEAGIELCIIDTSSCKYLNQSAKDKYWDILSSLLSRRGDSNS